MVSNTNIEYQPKDGRGLIVIATIVENCRVLLVMHADPGKVDYGHWLLPAGRVEPGETLEGALRREMREELGVEISIVRKVDERVDAYTGDRFKNFLCRPLISDIVTSSELKDARWFGIDDVKKIENIHPGLKQFLIEGFENDSFMIEDAE